MPTSLIPLALYLRMSDPRQDASIERQLAALEHYCQKKGYEIVAIYKDEGIPGDEFEKRKALQQLLKEAHSGRWQRLICDEDSRLKRMPYDDFVVRIKHPLKTAGIQFETVAAGPIPWDSSDWMSNMKDFFASSMSVEEVKKLSARVLKGNRTKAKAGSSFRRPYGYKVELVDGRRRLVPDEPKAAIVRWIFEQYETETTSCAGLAAELDRRGVAPPAPAYTARGKKPGNRKHSPKWSPQTVTKILRDEVYIGTDSYGRRSVGKYHTWQNGEATPVVNQTRKATWQALADQEIREEAHEALIARELFDQVQTLLDKNALPHKSLAAGGHTLSGLLTCGLCGRTLHAKKEYVTKATGPVRYCCPLKDTSDRPPCGHTKVKEADVLSAIELLLGSQLGNREEWRAERLAAIEAEGTAQASVRTPEAIEAELTALQAEIDGRIATIHRMPASVQERLGKEIDADIAKQKQLERELTQAKQVRPAARAVVEDLEEKALRLRDALTKGDPASVRKLLNANGVNAIIHGRREQHGKYVYFIPELAGIETIWGKRVAVTLRT